MQLGRFFEIRFVVYKIGSTISIFPPSFHSFLFWISRHDDDSRGNLAARLGTEIGVDCRNLVPALLNLRPPIPIFFHGAACYTAKLTHLSRGKEREREREENRATMYPIPAGQDCVSLKKTARVAFTACHLLATRNRATSRFFFFFNFNYSRVNVNCDRLGECIRGWKETDAKQIDSNLSDCHTQVPRLPLFQGISEFNA